VKDGHCVGLFDDKLKKQYEENKIKEKWMSEELEKLRSKLYYDNYVYIFTYLLLYMLIYNVCGGVLVSHITKSCKFSILCMQKFS